MKIFSVRDYKADFYQRPFFVQNKGEALRAFTQMVNDKKNETPLSMYPDDFGLYELGDFSIDTGVITALSSPLHICTGRDVFTS